MKFHLGIRPEISDDPSEAEVYEWFGATSFAAQVLEQGILVTLVVLASKGTKVSESEWNSFYETYDRSTLGQMLRKLSGKHDFPDGLAALLDSALKERNRLAHQFFADYSEALAFPAGRKRMIDDLSSMMTLFFKADGVRQRFFEFQRDQLGMNDGVIAKLVDHMMNEHLAKHPNG